MPQLTSIKEHLCWDGRKKKLVAVNSEVFRVNLWCRDAMARLWGVIQVSPRVRDAAFEKTSRAIAVLKCVFLSIVA